MLKLLVFETVHQLRLFARRPAAVFFVIVMPVLLLGKAGILGASIGVALLGALDLANAIAARDWATEMQKEVYLDYFAIGGGLAGIIGQTIRSIIFR
jgi:uncharacterized membrane protein